MDCFLKIATIRNESYEEDDAVEWKYQNFIININNITSICAIHYCGGNDINDYPPDSIVHKTVLSERALKRNMRPRSYVIVYEIEMSSKSKIYVEEKDAAKLFEKIGIELEKD